MIILDQVCVTVYFLLPILKQCIPKLQFSVAFHYFNLKICFLAWDKQCVSLPIFQHNVLFSFLTMFMFSNKMMMIYCLSCYQWQYFSITISTCNTYTDTSAILTTTSLYAHISININLESILVLLWLLSPLILSTVIMIFFLQGIGLESVDN